MTKIFITVILFMLALSILASPSQQELQALLKDQHLDLTYGVVLPEARPYNDFSTFAKPPYYMQLFSHPMWQEPDGFLSPYSSWYHTDFAEDPFDGRIEPFVVGEPLPPATATLLIALGMLGIIKCRKLHFNQAI